MVSHYLAASAMLTVSSAGHTEVQSIFVYLGNTCNCVHLLWLTELIMIFLRTIFNVLLGLVRDSNPSDSVLSLVRILLERQRFTQSCLQIDGHQSGVHSCRADIAWAQSAVSSDVSQPCTSTLPGRVPLPDVLRHVNCVAPCGSVREEQ